MQMNSCGADAPFKPDPDNPFTEDGNDMVYNYMDGGFCQSAFTLGQIERMHWALAEYKPGLINADFELMDLCSPSLASFNATPNSSLLVGQELSFANKNTSPDFIHRWYVDGILVSEDIHLTTSFDQAKVYTIRLETAKSNGVCKDIFWSMQAKIKVTCAEHSVILDMPKSMQIDSCYEVSLTNAFDVQWTFENQITNAEKITICPSQLGTKKLDIEYMHGNCLIQDSVYFFARDDNDIRHYFSGYKMPFALDTASTPLVSALEKIDEKTFVMFGAEYFNRKNFNEDTTSNFIRFWSPNMDKAIQWELYHIPQNDLSNDYGYYPNMQIFPSDMMLDSLGNIYFIAFERYSRFSDMSTYFVGKTNKNGNILWAKRLRTPSIKISKDPPIGDAELFLSDNQVIIQAFSNFYILNTQGQLKNAITLKMNPDSLYREGLIFFSKHKSELRNDNITIVSEILLLNPEDYIPFSDNLVSDINENTNALISIDLNFDSLQYQYFSIDDDIVRSEVVTSTAFKNGTLMLFKDSEGNGFSLNSFFTLIHLDNNNEVLNQKQYSIDGEFFSSFSFELTELYTLNNNQIIIVTRIEGGEKLLYLRFDEDLELIEHRIYENPFLDEPFGTERASYKVLDNNSSLLVNDGILVASHVDERKQDKLYFHHLPLDSNFVQCEQIFLKVNKDTLPIFKPRTEPLVWAEPIELELEDINIHIRKSLVDISLPECRSTYVLEDFYFGNIDTTCTEQTTIQYKLDICRNNTESKDSTSLSLYQAFPLEQAVTPTSRYQVLFNEKQICQTITIEEIVHDYYFALNVKENYPSPYTLEKTFFDAHQIMEYDYSNNITFIEAQNCLDTSVENKNDSAEFQIYPNPTDNIFSILSETKIIEALSIYSVTGKLLYHELTDDKKIIVDEHFLSGLYIVEVFFKDGLSVSKKLIIGR